MNQSKHFLVSPYNRTEELKEIIQYAKRIGQSDDFKELKLYFVHFNDTNTLRKKLKLVDYFEQLKRMELSLISTLPPFLFYGGMHIYPKGQIFIFIDNLMRFGNIKGILLSNRNDIKSDSLKSNRLKPVILPKVKIIKSEDYIKKTCCSILQTMYHEKKHNMQQLTKDNTFESIMFQIEMNIKASFLFGMPKYLFQHDSWYHEIDANNYGIDKTIEYYHNHPDDDHVDMDYLQLCQNKYKTDELTYNFDTFFTAYNIYREKIPFISQTRNIISKIFLKDRMMAWHMVLYGDNKRLKSVEKILNNPLINQIDQKFVNYVLTSRYLNKKTDYDKLSYETLIRLLAEFQRRLNTISSVLDKQNLIISKKKLTQLKKDIEYYRNNIAILQSKIDSYSKLTGR